MRGITIFKIIVKKMYADALTSLMTRDSCLLKVNFTIVYDLGLATGKMGIKQSH